MEKPDLKRGLYRGLVTEVARTLGKKPSNTYAAIFLTETLNKEKELFIKLKAEREEKAQQFRNALRKAV